MNQRFFATLLLILICAVALPAQTLYGTTAGPSGSGNLLTINTATGAATVVGPLVDSGGNHYAVTGIAFQAGTGVLFGSTSTKSTTAPHTLVTINPTNGRVSQIGNMVSHGNAVADIAFTPDGNLWGWWEASTTEDRLVSINTSTGAATGIPATGNRYFSTYGDGMAASQSGIMYACLTGEAGSLYTVNLSTGLPTSVATLSGGHYGGDGSISAARFSPSGVLYAVDHNDNGSAGGGSFLVTINLASGVMTTIGASDPELDGIAFQIGGPPTVPVLSGWLLAALAIALAGFAAWRLHAPNRSVTA